MACKELSALRLGMMELIGIVDPAEKDHDLRELEEDAVKIGPIKSLIESGNLMKLQQFYEHVLSDLQERVSKMDIHDSSYAYHQALLVLTKKVEQDLGNQIEGMKKLYLDLDEIHHYLHDLYPSGEKD